jgi:hypothetical protein
MDPIVMQNMPYPAVQLLSKIVDLRRDKTLSLRGNAEPMEILMTLIRRRDDLEATVIGQAAKIAELREELAKLKAPVDTLSKAEINKAQMQLPLKSKGMNLTP